MAKAKNAGLGRGLNSLLSGTYEDAAIEKPKTAAKPPVAPKPAVQEEKKAEKPAPQSFEEVKEEHVTIKGVVTRETDAVPIGKIKPNPD